MSSDASAPPTTSLLTILCVALVLLERELAQAHARCH